MEASKTAVTPPDETTVARPGLDAGVWGVPVAVGVLATALIVLLFYDSFRSIVSIWARSDTFAHGFLILPISLYLIWDDRARLRGLVPSPEYRALPLLAFAGFGWLCCRLTGVLVLEQYFAVAAIPIAVWTVFGNAVTRRLAFPLGFLLLGVPIGEFLIPPLIDFTAAFTVGGLRLTGVAVLQNGNLLTLAGSQWSVVEACSGLRYLIACVTLGFLYAHLTYRSWWRRGLCILASVVVPIIANGFRAFMIVMIGHLSKMTLAVGIDHLIAGWVFFGVVVFLFFWVGSFFREDDVELSDGVSVDDASSPVARSRFFIAGIAVVVIAAVWPIWVGRSEAFSGELPSSGLSLLPVAFHPWTAMAIPPTEWTPHYVGASFSASQWYEYENGRVGSHIACYVAQKQGAELVNSSNTLIGPEYAGWRQVGASERAVALASGNRDVVEGALDIGGAELIVWKWYWIDGASTVSSYRAKFVELKGKLLANEPLACGLSVFTVDDELARVRMTDWLNGALPGIEAELVTIGNPRR